MKPRGFRVAMVAAATSVAALTVAKATRDTLFVSVFPLEWLPYALIATGLGSALLVSVYTRLVARYALATVAPLLPAFFALLFGGSAVFARGSESRPLVAALYLLLGVGSSLVLSAFWSLFSESTDVRSARLALPSLTLTSSVGGLVGALLSSVLLSSLGPSSLLPLVAALNCVASVLLWLMRSSAQVGAARPAIPREVDGGGLWTGVRSIAKSEYLMGIAAFVFLLAIAGAFADYSLKGVALARYSSASGLAQFFVTFHGVVAGVTLASQLLVAQPMLERRGLAATLALLPGFLVVVATLSTLYPLLIVLAVLRGGETALKNSAHKAAYELLFVPLGSREKQRTRAVFDTLLDRVAEGTAALLLLALILVVNSPRVVAVGIAAFAVACVALIPRLRRGYVGALTSRLHEASAEGTDADFEPAIFSEVLAARTMQRTLSAATPETRERLSRTSFGKAFAERGSLLIAPSGTLRAAPLIKLESIESNLLDELRSADSVRVRAGLMRWQGQDRTVVSAVVDLLDHQQLAGVARQSLEAKVDRHIGALSDHLLDPSLRPTLRRRIVGVMGSATTPRVLPPLIEVLADAEEELRSRAAKVLRKLHQRGLCPAVEVIDSAVARELARASTVPHLRIVFDLLALRLPARPLDLAFDALSKNDAVRRPLALEYLENALPEAFRIAIFRLLEAPSEVVPVASRRGVELIVAELDPTAKKDA